MKWSFRIARVAGIEVRLHVTFLLLVAFYAWVFADARGPAAAVHGVTLILLLFFCILLHEFGHAFAARAFGIRTPDITLLPIGGVARLERIPSSPWQEFVIAVAGPAVNVVIVGILAAVTGYFPTFEEGKNLNSLEAPLLPMLLVVNAALILFNMIPAFPMDGGRVLRALLAMRLPHATATLIAARVGQALAVGCAAYMFLPVAASFWPELALVLAKYEISPRSNPILILIAFVVFIGANQELAYSRLRQRAGELRVGTAMITEFATLPDDLSSGEVASRLVATDQSVFPIVDEHLRLCGIADREELLAAGHAPDAPIRALARRVTPVRTDMGFEEAFDIMQRTGEGVLPVLNASGQIVGLVAVEQLTSQAGGAPENG